MPRIDKKEDRLSEATYYHDDEQVDNAVREIIDALYEKTASGTRMYKGKIKGMDYNFHKNKKKDAFDKALVGALKDGRGQRAIRAFVEMKYEAQGLSKEDAEAYMKANGNFRPVTTQDIKRARKRSEREDSKVEKSTSALAKFLNKQMNVIFNNQFTFYGTPEMICVADTNRHHMQEHYFCYVMSHDMNKPGSLLERFGDLFNLEDRFYTDINIRRDQVTAKPGRSPQWVLDHINRPQMQMFNGGDVTPKGATFRKFDQIDCILCAHEFVMTQEAVRGAGRGSYSNGKQFMYFIMDYFEREAKKYAHAW